MRILWIVNMMLPELAQSFGVKTSTSGTWMINLSKELSNMDDVELAIACVSGDEFVEKKIGKITYFTIPGNGKTMMFYNKNIEKYWDKIEQRFNPEIVHFHGTEYTHGISYLRKYKDKKKVLTIQGIIEKTSSNHWGNLSFYDVIKNRTIKENLKLNGMIERKILSRKNVKYENELIKSVNYATGRTDWDKFYMTSINPNLKYYRCYYNLREEFYDAKKWNIRNINRNTIYASTSAQVPMKGGHIVLKAIDIVRKTIPDVKFIFLAHNVHDGKLIPTSGYTKYICKLINKLQIEKNVEFIPAQSTEGIIETMTKSHITLVPSAMENASATLREAMHLGVPCIASFRGGMTELINDGVDGYYYDYSEFEYLAGRIIQILKNDDIAVNLSTNASKSAEKWHNIEMNTKSYISMYKDIMEE